MNDSDKRDSILKRFRWLWLAGAVLLGAYLILTSGSPTAANHAAARRNERLPITTNRTTTVKFDQQGQPKSATRNIEDVRVGDRVLAHNPEVTNTERASWEEPDWPHWMKLSLVMAKPDGSELVIEMLRPEDWVISQTRFVVDEPRVNYVEAPAEQPEPQETQRPLVPLRPAYQHLATQRALIESHGLRVVALTVELDLPELGLTGDAIVIDIDPLATIETGSGCVVTATFHHSSRDVLELIVVDEGEERETIGTTSNHPFWSVDRNEYVQAGALESGERVLTFAGDTKRIASKLPRPGPQPVYNLEVYGEHVYFVGDQGLLVHNSCAPNSAVTRTNAQLVDEIGSRSRAWAQRKQLTGSARALGSRQHKHASDVLDRYQRMFGDRGLVTERSFINGMDVPYGAKGSTRLDVLDTITGDVWDYKFGVTPMSQSQVNRIFQHGPGINSVTPLYK